MRLMLPFNMRRLPEWAVSPLSPQDYVLGSRHVTERDVVVRRAVWARYNRRARTFGRRAIIESC